MRRARAARASKGSGDPGPRPSIRSRGRARQAGRRARRRRRAPPPAPRADSIRRVRPPGGARAHARMHACGLGAKGARRHGPAPADGAGGEPRAGRRGPYSVRPKSLCAEGCTSIHARVHQSSAEGRAGRLDQGPRAGGRPAPSGRRRAPAARMRARASRACWGVRPSGLSRAQTSAGMQPCRARRRRRRKTAQSAARCTARGAQAL